MPRTPPTRRKVLQTALAAGVLAGRAHAQDRYDQAALLDVPYRGDLSLMHFSDLRGQLYPGYFRPTDSNIGVGDTEQDVPHLTGEALRVRYGIGGRTHMDYAMTHEAFAEHARTYGPMGGVAHLATAIKAVRAARPDSLLLAGGVQLPAVAGAVRALRPDFQDAAGGLASSVWMRGGVKVAVLSAGGDRPTVAAVQRAVEGARADGAGVVIYLARGGFGVDRALAEQTTGLDIIFTGHSHIATPEPEVVGGTHIIGSGGQGQFLSLVDLDIEAGAIGALRHRLIPIFSELIVPDPILSRLIGPALTAQELGRADRMLSRRGTLSASWDRVLCDALLAQTKAEISMVPGHRWGETVLPGQPVTQAHLRSVLDGGAVQSGQVQMTGAEVKNVLEQSAEVVFSSELAGRGGEDLIRAGGVSFTVTPSAPRGARVSALRLTQTGAELAVDRSYAVASWDLPGAVTTERVMFDLVAQYFNQRRAVVVSAPSVVLVE